MRKPIELTEEMKALKPREQSDIITQTRHYRLITPLFGGGVEPGVVDEITPVRGTAVRGHLRFWWRATRGGHFHGDLAQMKAKEDEIWGSSSTESKFFLAIAYPDRASRKGKPFQDTHKRDGRSVSIGDPASRTGYVAFSLRQTANDAVENEVIENIAFTMTVTFVATYRQDVEAALWAWETFGGIGARTRRGFGALECFLVEEDGQESDPRYTITNLKEKLQSDWATHLAGGNEFPEHVPHLGAEIDKHIAITHAGGSGDGVNVWIGLIEKLQAFRHKRPQNRVTEGNRTFIRPGRNRWPEPDVIRDKVEPRKRKYPDAIYTPPIDKAPRAAFGLPIIFELRNEGITATLKGADKNHDRFASPLILRPLACQNNQYAGIALTLAGSTVNDIPGGMILDGVRGNPPVSAQLTPNEAEQIAAEAKKINPNDNYNGDPDILQAFLAALKE
ncbi:MAG TPA: type III-B CRISPR module RAMP protein Cmr1 [Anaerolineae bacterium]|nr:type III-B CRISPR module RAMP protein Cmr1 [Anaerolineae bacterium]HIP72466.1 type III-B CRISPR module RAMP protein Cmr1 [Anaerolineae bacterium]